MRALYFDNHGELDSLRYGQRPSPDPGPGEVVLDVRAAALNHLDLFVLHGLPGIPVPLPHIGGADGAGVISAVGEGISGWSVGDEVVFNPGLWCGSCELCQAGQESLCVHYGIIGEHRDGTFAECVRVPAIALSRRPRHMSWVEAAAFPLTFLTAWRLLVTRGHLVEGETVLIHGIGGGLALAALLMAKRLGATVFVTSSSEDKLSRARELGADGTINYVASDVAREIRALTEKRGVDLVVDSTGAATWMASLRCACRGGRIVTAGATTGPNPTEEIRIIFWNQLSILGSTMGSAADWQRMIEAVSRWHLVPVIDTVFPLEKGRDAMQRMARGGQFGKIVLAVEDDETVAMEHEGV